MSGENITGGKKSWGRGCLRWLGRVTLWGLVLLLGLAAIGAVYQIVATVQDAKLYQPADQMVEVDGVQMRLDCRGSGSPTVVLEAGSQSPSYVWMRVQDDVAKFTRVCSYDRAGYGWSEAVHETLSPQRVVEMLHALLENGGEAPPYLMVGHSFGGVYIRTFTAKYPDEVVGMVLVDSSHENQAQQTPPEFAQSPQVEQNKNAAILSLRLLQVAEPLGLLRAFKFMDAGVNSLPLPEEQVESVRAQMYRSGYVGAYMRETIMTSTYAGQPAKLGDIPLVVLSTKVDAQTMDEMYGAVYTDLSTETMQQLADLYNGDQDELAALSTRGRRIIVEDTGHFIQLDKPETVIAAIREVFDQVAR